jgi:hypothetical protein
MQRSLAHSVLKPTSLSAGRDDFRRAPATSNNDRNMPITTSDSRLSARRVLNKTGRIIFNRGRSSVDCVVKNLSKSGARLAVATVVGIPDAFFLSSADATGTQACRVVWRRLKEVGVKFETS